MKNAQTIKHVKAEGKIHRNKVVTKSAKSKQVHGEYIATNIGGEFLIDRRQKSEFGHYTNLCIPVAVSGNKQEVEQLINKANMNDELMEIVKLLLNETNATQLQEVKNKAFQFLRQTEKKQNITKTILP